MTLSTLSGVVQFIWRWCKQLPIQFTGRGLVLSGICLQWIKGTEIVASIKIDVSRFSVNRRLKKIKIIYLVKMYLFINFNYKLLYFCFRLIIFETNDIYLIQLPRQKIQKV